MSANVFCSVFNTYTVFLAATVPFVSSADSNVTVQYLLVSCGFPPFGSSGSTGPTTGGSCGVTFAVTVRFAVSSCKLPLVNTTGFPLSSNVKAFPFVGFAVIPFAAKSAKATFFVKPWLSVNVTSSPVRSSFSPSV